MTKNHIRFDWAAKKMLRDKKNFDILEGFLSELLKEDIKIEGLLESEGNQEESDDKFNRVDLYAENSKGEHIIIEIQNTRELDYLMRMLYATSKAVVEYLDIKDNYAKIKKVIAVSIVYFGLGKGDDYIYYGHTKFTGLHTHKDLELTTTQKELINQPTIAKAYPEYYLIQTTKFNDVIKDTLDEWVYFFKNSEVLDSFRAKGMKAVREKMSVMTLTKEQRWRYNSFIDDMRMESGHVETLKIEAKEELKSERRKALREKKKAVEQAVKENEQVIIIKCIKRGDTNEDISEITGTAIEKIEILRKQIEAGNI